MDQRFSTRGLARAADTSRISHGLLPAIRVADMRVWRACFGAGKCTGMLGERARISVPSTSTARTRAAATVRTFGERDHGKAPTGFAVRGLRVSCTFLRQPTFFFFFKARQATLICCCHREWCGCCVQRCGTLYNSASFSPVSPVCKAFLCSQEATNRTMIDEAPGCDCEHTLLDRSPVNGSWKD